MKPELRPENVPALRVRQLNGESLRADGHYVLHWMTAFRRTGWNASLEYSVEMANRLGRPLVVFEALRSEYQWASLRLHRFILEGTVDNSRTLDASAAASFVHVEPTPDAGADLLERLAASACLVVSDDFPSFFLPRMLQATARRLECPLVVVDANGLLPLRATERVFSRAYDFRRYLQKELPPHLEDLPQPDPLESLDHEVDANTRELLTAIEEDYPRSYFSTPFHQAMAGDDGTDPLVELIASLPIDQGVGRAAMKGGQEAALAELEIFLDARLPRYADGRLDVEERATSQLSPYLHFGHISPAQVFARLAEREQWSPLAISETTRGQREGYWGMSVPAESFLDELITWRELGYNMAHLRHDSTEFGSLPDWARKTIAEHSDDERPYSYSLDQFEGALTHDQIWNAAQRELVTDGRMHNYLRMLWGKKIYEWSPDAESALEVMVHLNNKYAVDGRNPNSYSGIFWCLGRYDRAWGPERPIFGKLRYMTSDSTRRKMKLDNYLERYGSQSSLF